MWCSRKIVQLYYRESICIYYIVPGLYHVGRKYLYLLLCLRPPAIYYMHIQMHMQYICKYLRVRTYLLHKFNNSSYYI